MRQVTSMLLTIRSFMKLYEQSLEEIRINYRLSQMEITIISFLHNNPGRDTTGDIAELRMLPKGNVSQGVEALAQKRLLERTSDLADRRKIHLNLTKEADSIVTEIEEAKKKFIKMIFEGFTPEEIRIYSGMNERITENTMKYLERR